MKFIEPAFDPAEASWQTMPGATQDDVSDLPDRLAKQSTELSLRLNEILELYNIQSRQEEALQIAGEEIVRLKQTISGLQEFATRQKEEEDKVVRLESEKADLLRPLASRQWVAAETAPELEPPGPDLPGGFGDPLGGLV
jgi:hypothetical protein